MQSLRHHLRTCLLLALMPLTLFQGRAVAGCVCADGHFELFCQGERAAWSSRKTASKAGQDCTKSCCQSKAVVRTGSVATAVLSLAVGRGCGAPGAGTCGEASAPQPCCRPLTLVPMTTEERHTLPHPVGLLAENAPVVQRLLPPVVTPSLFVPDVDAGPPQERLPCLQRWQI